MEFNRFNGFFIALLSFVTLNGYTSTSSHWIDLQDIPIYKGKDYLLKITNITSNLHIKLSENNTVISIQNSPVELAHHDYIFIPKKQFNRNYTVSIKPKYNLKVSVLPVIEIDEILDLETATFYKKLSNISILNFSQALLNNSTDLHVIDELIADNLPTFDLSELYLYKLSLLLSSRNFRELIDTIKNIDTNKIENKEYLMLINWFSAMASLNVGNYNKAINLFEQSLSLLDNKFKENKFNKKLIIKLLAYYGLAQSVRYHFDSNENIDGYKYINLALLYSKEIEDEYLIAEVLYILGSYYSAINEWSESISILDNAEKISVKINFKENLIGIFNQKAIAYREINQLNKSLKNYRLAIEQSKELNKQNDTYFFYRGLASIYKYLGDFDLAKRYYYIYLDYSKREYKMLEAIALNELGIIARINQNLQLALQLHNKSREYYSGKESNSYIDLTSELSMDLLEQKKYSKSELYAQHVIKLSSFREENKNKVGSINAKKFSFWNFNEYIMSLPASKIKMLVDKSEITLQSNYVVKSLIVLARLSFIRNEYIDLKKYLSLIKNNLSLLSIDNKLKFYKLELDYYKIVDDFIGLNNSANKALILINQTRKQFDVSDLALHWTHKAKSILDKYINALFFKNNHVKIFEILEKYYAINLREKRQNTTSQIIQQKSKKIQQALDNYVKLERETLLSKDDDVQNKADEAKEHFLALNENEQKTQKRELTYLTIEELQKKLSGRELFLRYYLNEKYAFVFVIDNKSFEVMQLPDKSQLRYMVKTILKNIKSKRFNELTEQNDLFNKILPQEKIISGLYEKIIIIPDGVLNLLPFSSININPNAGNYTPLVSKINIERTYSASDYFADIELPNNEKTISVFSNPVFLQGSNNKELLNSIPKTNKLWEFVSLPNTSQEAEAIEEIFSNFEIHKMSGKSATNENLLSEKTSNSNIIHIATHGFFNDENLENVGIATTIIDENNNRAPGVLAMREILYQPFKANLAVVSGCETTLGKEINGEGFNSLSRGLLSQGVGSVVGTIWSISDRATPIFMKEFYTNLKDMDGNVSEALNTTKSNFATLSKFRRYRHPYYWAGFVLTSSNRGISENIFN